MTRTAAPRIARRPYATLALVVAFALVAGAVAACSVFGDGLTGRTWQLSALTEKVPAAQMVVPAADQSRYQVTFGTDGTATIKADCNNVLATYSTEGGSLISIVPGPSTLVACPADSLADKFVAGLTAASSYNVHGAELTLYIGNEGTMEFIIAPE